MPVPAILQIVTLAHDNVPIKMLNLLLRSLSILRLFSIGGVAYRSYTEDLVLFAGFTAGPVTSLQEAPPTVYKYKVEPKDVNNLIGFWKKMSVVIPPYLYSCQENDGHYLRIAYERYCEAILSNRPWEFQIMMASMALEGLLLNNEGELKYRLTTFAAKVLGMLGLDPIQVKDRLGIAYLVRSTYVHGGQWSPQRIKNVLKKESTAQFTRTVLDYVRICLVAFIFLNGRSKDDLTKLIDRSLISEDSHRELQGLLSEAKDAIETLPHCGRAL